MRPNQEYWWSTKQPQVTDFRCSWASRLGFQWHRKGIELVFKSYVFVVWNFTRLITRLKRVFFSCFFLSRFGGGALSSNVFTICAVYWSLGRRGYFGDSNVVIVPLCKQVNRFGKLWVLSKHITVTYIYIVRPGKVHSIFHLLKWVMNMSVEYEKTLPLVKIKSYFRRKIHIDTQIILFETLELQIECYLLILVKCFTYKKNLSLFCCPGDGNIISDVNIIQRKPLVTFCILKCDITNWKYTCFFSVTSENVIITPIIYQLDSIYHCWYLLM